MKRKLLNHIFFSNIDTGILMIYLPLYVWRLTGTFSFVVTSVVIPIVMNVFFDAFFSKMGDLYSRRMLVISGLVISGLALMFLGYAESIVVFLLILGVRSLAEVMYMTNMAPVYRNAIPVEEYQGFIIRKNQVVTIASVIGGGVFYLFAGYINDYKLLFILTGIIEIFSVISILNVDINGIVKVSAVKKYHYSVILKYKELIMALAFGFVSAALYSRLMVYGFQTLSFDDLDFAEVFVMVFVSSTFILQYLRKIIFARGNTGPFVFSLIAMSAVVMLLSFEPEYTVYVFAWILVELFEAIAYAAINDAYNRRLSDKDGVESSYYRISRSLGTIAGAVVITAVTQMYGMMISFQITSALFITFGMVMIFKRYRLG